MQLFIQIKNGVPFEHPIFENNFRQAFPDVDLNNLPPEFARFERVERRRLGPYEVYEGVTYEMVDGVYKDVHQIRAMSEEEKAQKIALMQSLEHPEGWVFSHDKCDWVPPEKDTSFPGSAPNVIG